MNKTEQAQQLRLAAELIETGHPFQVCRARHQEWFKPDPMIVTEWMPPEYELRPILATPPDGRPLHNPANLTAEQVGAGWRLLLPEEVDGRYPLAKNECHWWSLSFAGDEENGEGWAWASTSPAHNCTDTYRVPLSVPWPEASKPEPPPFQLPPPPISWRYAETTKTVKLGPEDVPPMCAIRCSTILANILRVCDKGVWIVGQSGKTYLVCWEELHDSWQINRSIPLTGRWNPTLWEPCHKTNFPR